MTAILTKIHNQHPYSFSFLLSVAILSLIIFYSPIVIIENIDTSDFRPEFIDIEKIQLPKRVVKKEVSSEKGEVTQESTERAKGVSDVANAIDLAFYPNIAPPKLIGRLKKRYPKSAKDLNVEAILNIEILINPKGIVRKIKVTGVKLSKQLPSELSSKIVLDFAREAKKMLLGARFTSPIVEGKKVPVRLEIPLRFTLEN